MNFRPVRFMKKFFNAIYAIEPMQTQLNEMKAQIRTLHLEHEKQIAFLHFIENQKNKKTPLKENSFALFDYSYHFFSNFGANLGDEIQTFATQNALNTICENPQFSFVSRDFLNLFSGGGRSIVPMQAWFAHSPYFLPPADLTPLWVGTHFSESAQEFLRFVLARQSHYFQNQTIGCRDLYTLNFCQKMGIPSYFSRCLTLTLPKRKLNESQNKIFLVGLNNEVLSLLPKCILNNAEIVNQQNVFFNPCADFHLAAQNILFRYETQAKLIITSALHCASPATAMGIPVVFVMQDEEQKTRFSALKNILPFYSVEDFKQDRINFSPEAPNVEELKQLMLLNLKKTLDDILQKEVNLKELNEVRQNIAQFSVFSR